MGGLLMLNIGNDPETEASPVAGTGHFDYGDDPVETPKPVESLPPAETTVFEAQKPVSAPPETPASEPVSAFADVPATPAPEPKPAEAPPEVVDTPVPEPQPTEALPPVTEAEPAQTKSTEVATLIQPPSAFSDIPSFPDTPRAQTPVTPVASAPPVAGDWQVNVFPLQCQGATGAAVAIAPDTLLTTFQLAKYAQADIGVNGQWLKGNVTHPQGANAAVRDAALVKVPNGQFPSLKIRAPLYYESVTLYGLKSQVKQRGFVSSARTISLLPETNGIAIGDAGGAVVGDDGALIGLVSGSEAGNLTGTRDNPRVVYITRADIFTPYIPSNRMSATAPPSNTLPEPVGSVFPPTNQPSAFDPPAPVNPPVASNQPSAFDPPAPVNPQTPTANCAEPKQSTAQAGPVRQVQSRQVYFYQQGTSQNCDNGNCTIPVTRRGRRGW